MTGQPTPDRPDKLDDLMARRIFEAALNERRAGELLHVLFDGGSATVDALTGRLTIITADQLQQMAGGVGG